MHSNNIHVDTVYKVLLLSRVKVVDKVFNKNENIPSRKNLNEIEKEPTVLHMQASETGVVRFQLFTEEVQDRGEFCTRGGDAGSRAHVDT